MSRFGIFIANSAPTIENNSIQNNGSGGIYQQTLANGSCYPKYDGNSFGADNRIHLAGNADKVGTIEYAAIPYVMDPNFTIQDGITLTVEAGVTLQFMNSENKMIVYGTLMTEGTASEPVTFTRAPELSGTWNYIQFYNENTNLSEMEYTIFEHGGHVFNETSNLGAIECRTGASPTFTNCTFQNSQNGIQCYEKANPQLMNCTFKDNNRFGINVINSSPHVEGCTISGNGAGGLHLNTSGIASTYPTFSNNTWTADNRIMVKGNIQEAGPPDSSNAPYVIDRELRIEGGAILTIDPGVQVHFVDGGSGLKVSNSSLHAIGTKALPIKFKRATENTDFWNRLYIFGVGDTLSIIDWCEFEYGGFTPLTDPRMGMISIDAGASPLITNTIVANSKNSGIFMNADANPIINLCLISGNAEFGATNTSKETIIDARKCWWGDPSGPYDRLDRNDDPTGLINKDGLGDKISDFIDYRDWLSVASGILPATVVPNEMELYQNFPNPFNPSTNVLFKVENYSAITIDVFDMNGRFVQRIFDASVEAGMHEARWNASGMASGSYLYTISNGRNMLTRTMVLSK